MQKLPERFLYIDISFSSLSRHLAIPFYYYKYSRWNFFYFYTAFLCPKLEMTWHLPTPNENATFFSILNSIICICSAGYRNEGKLIKTFCHSMILKQTADVLKIFPSQYFACYIKSCEWIVLTEMVFLNDKLKWRKLSSGIHTVMWSRPCSGFCSELSI